MKFMVPKKHETFVCPNCRADVPRGAKACPQCGADDETGWSPDTMYDNLDLPEPGWGSEEEDPAPDRTWLWKIAAVVLLVSLSLWMVFAWL